MRFAHLGDCHLGGWRQPELRDLNFQSFQFAIDTCIKERLDFVLIAGDLFDSAYPPIEIIKDAFYEFRKLKEANIPVFLIAGSHDYSASGRTFLDVIEKAGFATNVFKNEDRNGSIILTPSIYKNVAIYGYPGRKSGLEVGEIEKIKLQDAPGFFKILMLHTAIRDAIGTLPIPAVDQSKLPPVNYLALAHLHINYNKNNAVYCGPTFPNNAAELEELEGGSFYIVNTEGKIERKEIKLKKLITLKVEIKDALNATDQVIEELDKSDLKDKVVILKLHGTIERGRVADINFNKIDLNAKKRGAYIILRNMTNLHSQESEIKIDFMSENIEEEIISKFQRDHPSNFNEFIPSLLSVLQLEKKEEERSASFEERLMSDAKKTLSI